MSIIIPISITIVVYAKNFCEQSQFNFVLSSFKLLVSVSVTVIYFKENHIIFIYFSFVLVLLLGAFI